MMDKSVWAAAVCAAVAVSCASAQSGPGCSVAGGTVLGGLVRDSSGALVPGAQVTLDGSHTVTSGADGSYRFPCVASGSHHVSISMDGFAPADLSVRTPHAGALNVALHPMVEATVEVNGGDQPEQVNSTSGSRTLAGDQLQSLADDPDDLQRQLQQLAAASGGNPSNTTIAVDGFQGGSSLPPKSSIAYIRVNPDVFSAQYREPPFGGGRVEVYTKPGQSTYHGALFLTNGSPWENARDPFSTSKAAIGKQRYGFELSGPVRKQGSDFALTLEHRSIDDFAVVNAITLNNGTAINTIANVATPQRLWLGTARLGWQLGAKNTFTSTYSANVNHLSNVGVGGTNLQESGYDNQTFEHMFRVSDVTLISSHLMHEARASFRWDGSTATPVSTLPQIQVAGAFTGGGSTLGPQRLREFNLEVDDDAVLTTKQHTIVFGTQMQVLRERQALTTNFNGTYTFGGGVAPVLDANGNQVPGQTTTITGLEQYRRALNRLPGGTPTVYSDVEGTPQVAFTQLQAAFFVQDDLTLKHGLKVSSGLRYQMETSPTTIGGLTPRLSVLWSPNKKGTWTLYARVGMFTGLYGPSVPAEVMREDGVTRITSLAYNPVYSPISGGSPLTGVTPIHAMREFSSHFGTEFWGAEDIGGSRALPFGFNISGDYIHGRIWNATRSLNINSPLNGSPTGPRPGPANLNILQVNNSGQGTINGELMFLEQHSLKRLQFFAGAVHVSLRDDDDDNPFFTPQSSSTNAGEFSQRTGQGNWQIFGNTTLTVPGKVQVSTDFHAEGDSHYNITTGFDNNGDGDFNDRPQYAAPGQAGALQTPFGLLVSTGGTGVFQRNQGVMPWVYYLDMNVQRAFSLTHNKKADHQQTLTANVRSSNLLNHTNITAVGGVLGSPLFGVGYSADAGRRVEAGLRYSF